MLILKSSWKGKTKPEQIKLKKKLLILEREDGMGERERNIDLLLHLFMHSVPVYALTRVKPETLVYQYEALTNWAAWPGNKQESKRKS